MRILRFSAVAIMAMLFVVLAGGPTADAAEPGLESQYVAGLNSVRANNGQPPLAVDGALTAVARSWADHMASQNTISHNPNVGNQIGAAWVKIGENVGTGHDVGAVMQAFVNSDAHFRNIVDGDFDYVGVGVTYGSDGRMYTAHVFMDLDGGASAPAPPPAPEPEPTPAPAAPAPTPSAPVPAVEPPAPAPVAPPAAAAPERVATVLAIVAGLETGVR